VSKDWDKEMAKVDKQLASLSDEALLGPTPVQLPGGAAVPAKGGKTGKAAKAPSAASVPAEPRGTSSFGVYSRLLLSVALGAAMVIWPYPARCGAGLAGYLAAVVVVVASGIWSSVWTWRHRASRAHALSLLIVLWGLVLGSIDVLPRVGYAKPDAQHPASWTCPAPVALPGTTPAPSPARPAPPK
jgi:hypothetical protein